MHIVNKNTKIMRIAELSVVESTLFSMVRTLCSGKTKTKQSSNVINEKETYCTLFINYH